SALGADGVRAFHRHEGEEVDRDPGLAELHHRREARESSADDDHAADLARFGDNARLLRHIVVLRAESRQREDALGGALSGGIGGGPGPQGVAASSGAGSRRVPVAKPRTVAEPTRKSAAPRSTVTARTRRPAAASAAARHVAVAAKRPPA